jgi:sugar/nucleoside kinase (ribokinase family)
VSAPDLVLVGNLLVDDLVYDDGTTRMGRPGGALLHAALAASAWKSSVGLVSIVGTDYPKESLELLRHRGVSLEGLVHLPGPGVRVWLLYENGARRMIPRLGRPSHEDVSPLPAHVPKAFYEAKAMHVAPMPRTRQEAVIAALGDVSRLTSVDPCDLVDDSQLPAMRALLTHADVLFVSDDELSLEDAPRALASLVHGRTRYVEHRRGREGGVVYEAFGRTRTWSAHPAKEVEPTGAGDVFAAAFMASLAHGSTLDDAIARGAATASFAVEGVGSDALLTVEPNDLAFRTRGIALS